jgi:heme A synthase
MFRRAVHEIRVIAGLVLIVAAVAACLWELGGITSQADRDFALCGGARQAPDCVSKRRPVSVIKTDPSDELAQGSYEVVVQTSPNVTASLFGLTEADAAPFQGLETTEIRYRRGRLVAIVAPDGTAYEFPFALTKELLLVVGSAIVAGLLGMGSVAWGLTRVNRTPKA